jgi:ADP-ribosylglycohydrolase
LDGSEEAWTRRWQWPERAPEVTHNHPEGIRGAQATAAAMYIARTGGSKADIKAFVEREIGYDVSRTLEEIRPGYEFDVSCQGSVPESIIAFLEADGFEDTLRNAISLGGDADTMACIAGGIAEAFYGIPEDIRVESLARLDRNLRNVIGRFYATHSCGPKRRAQ